jgi:hypothetical protein
MHTGFWCVNLKDRNHFEDPDIGRRIILKWIYKIWGWRTWTGFVWLRIGIGDRVL